MSDGGRGQAQTCAISLCQSDLRPAAACVHERAHMPPALWMESRRPREKELRRLRRCAVLPSSSCTTGFCIFFEGKEQCANEILHSFLFYDYNIKEYLSI